MWIRFDENGGRQLLNSAVCSRIIVIDAEIMFYSPNPEGGYDHAVLVFEFNNHEDAVRAHWDIENALIKGETTLLIDYKFK